MSNIQLVENLYRLRKAHHYTQQEISDLLNISRQAYSCLLYTSDAADEL